MSGLALPIGLSASLELTPSTGLSNGNGLSLAELENFIYLYWASAVLTWGDGNYLEWS